MSRFTYAKLAEIINAMPEERKCDDVTFVTDENEVHSLAGICPVEELEEISDVLDHGHFVMFTR